MRGGTPTFAFVFGKGEIMVAAVDHHSKRGCAEWEKHNGRKIFVSKAAELMGKILYSRREVALVVGILSCTVLIIIRYWLKWGTKLVAGSNVVSLYALLDLGNLTAGTHGRSSAPANICPNPNFPYDAKYSDWSTWSGDEAAWWAKRAMCAAACSPAGDRYVTVYRVGPTGVKTVFADI
ncbi:OLC1v1037335C1 [Oldenlandia corymbosa var. corymbosa]|uniref:OLC1v1037335C1 n=1 Tax=Oldenlandia corymbosa var. corymbosa TaxID=529605 RepID=A0AAV1CY36_OLDCO|nr:OLC1v1037335C1 [Oldenlandia corymbosa var. corymbosa]